ncbi:hypothetical protein [Bradyrhizobium sp. AZCC 1693]
MDRFQIGTHFLALAAAFALVALAGCGFVQASENLRVHSPAR